MGLLDDLAGKAMGGLDIGALASKVGLSEAQVQTVLAALGKHQSGSGDAVSATAAESGVAPDKVQSLLSMIGGEGALGKLGGLAGGALGGLGGMLGKK